ncbi:MAG: hypothetical protein OXH08_13275 [Gammaproteobacteria bacterium]|nr:hypothetical protein [Gammaproteobacteria bacterium]
MSTATLTRLRSTKIRFEQEVLDWLGRHWSGGLAGLRTLWGLRRYLPKKKARLEAPENSRAVLRPEPLGLTPEAPASLENIRSMRGKATMSQLVTLEGSGVADLAGAKIHKQQRGSDLLYVTKRTGSYVLGVNAGGMHNLPHGLKAHVTYRYLSHQEAAEWLIKNDHEVPRKLLASVSIL